ncbi:chromosome partitioning protein ParA [Halobacteriales archaeon SW_5_70_135]|nr:MAG: chromosome partitioning protein ParA [Halobacteriales archaeon SW_5_70_135]
MILAVAGGKGGVGKTTVALNLARELDAVLVDADLGMADVPASHGPDLHDVLAGRAAPVEAVREDGPVDVLPCGRSLSGARAAETTALVAAIERVDRAYGGCVVDCPAGLSADAGLPLLAAGLCVLVTTPDRVSLPDAVRTWALANELDAGVARVALNRTGDDPPTDRVERALGAPTVAIPDSRTVAAATASGRPVAAVASNASAVDRFRALADGVRSCLGRS